MEPVPYCAVCDRHLTPTSMRPDGSCPVCASVLPLVRPQVVTERPDDQAEDQAPAEGAPWHFKVLLGALGLYLAWRGVQGVGWLVDHV